MKWVYYAFEDGRTVFWIQVPGTLVLVGLFLLLVGRPMRQIDRAIRELGEGDFSRPITVSGPHDIELLPESSNGALEAMIVRVTMLGRDAKVELHDARGAELIAILTRDRFEELELWRGQTVWVRPKPDRVLAAS